MCNMKSEIESTANSKKAADNSAVAATSAAMTVAAKTVENSSVTTNIANKTTIPQPLTSDPIAEEFYQLSKKYEIEKNYLKSYEYLVQAADKKHISAAKEYYILLCNEASRNEQIAQQIENFYQNMKEAADSGNAEAQVFIGKLNLQKHPEIALGYFQSAITQGSAAGLYYLGYMKSMGAYVTNIKKGTTETVVAKDKQSAISYLKSAAEKGHSAAYLLLGELYSINSENSSEGLVNAFYYVHQAYLAFSVLDDQTEVNRELLLKKIEVLKSYRNLYIKKYGDFLASQVHSNLHEVIWSTETILKSRINGLIKAAYQSIKLKENANAKPNATSGENVTTPVAVKTEETLSSSKAITADTTPTVEFPSNPIYVSSTPRIVFPTPPNFVPRITTFRDYEAQLYREIKKQCSNTPLSATSTAATASSANTVVISTSASTATSASSATATINAVATNANSSNSSKKINF